MTEKKNHSNPMYTSRMPARVFKARNLCIIETKLCFIIGQYHNHKPHACVKVSTVCNRLGIFKTTFKTIMIQLQEKGYITIIHEDSTHIHIRWVI